QDGHQVQEEGGRPGGGGQGNCPADVHRPGNPHPEADCKNQREKRPLPGLGHCRRLADPGSGRVQNASRHKRAAPKGAALFHITGAPERKAHRYTPKSTPSPPRSAARKAGRRWVSLARNRNSTKQVERYLPALSSQERE